MGINAAMDWCWMVRDLTLSYSKEANEAHRHIVGPMLGKLEEAGIPHEFVYDEVANTSNITLPQQFVTSEFRSLFEAAGFKEKLIPEKDTQASMEMREALLSGAQMDKKWN